MTSKFLLKFCVVCFLGQSVLSITYTQAQEVLPLGRTAVNTIYGEVFGSASGGNATNYSINYERVVENVLALRVGVGCILHNPRQDGFSNMQVQRLQSRLRQVISIILMQVRIMPRLD